MAGTRALTLVAVLLACGVYAAGADSAKVTEVRFWSLGSVTRIAVEVDSDFKYKQSRLPDPDRLFFDIQGARPEMAPQGMHTIAVGDKLLKQIRVAETQKGVTRVVLDLEDKVEYSTSQLARPARLMIELRSSLTPAEAPALTSIGSHVIHEVSREKPAPRRFDPPPMDLTPRPVRVAVREAHVTMPPAAFQALASAKPPKLATGLPRFAPPPVLPAVRVDAKPTVSSALASVREPLITSPVNTSPVNTSPAEVAVPARTNTGGGQSMTRVLGLKLGRVVLDAGHGGSDVGTRGPGGLYEKDLVLDVSLRLGALLEQRLGSEVIYTRSDDSFVHLEERTRIANEHRADLFLSIHANSSPVRSVSGVETYYLSFTTSKTALDTASRENASSEHSIFELKDLLSKIALKDKVDESREFASRVQNSLYTISAKTNKATQDRGIKRAPFVVLIGASMPSVLAEIGFLTNPADEALLNKEEHRDKIAEALYKGIAAYAETLSRAVVAQTK